MVKKTHGVIPLGRSASTGGNFANLGSSYERLLCSAAAGKSPSSEYLFY